MAAHRKQEEQVIKKSRFVVSVGVVAALGAGTLAFADGVSENEAFVDGSIKPTKLDKKKYKPINLFSGVRTETTIDGTQFNPVSEYISYPKNVKFDFNAGDVCNTLPAPGSTRRPGAGACPNDSYLGSGEAEVQGAGGVVIDDLIVSVFRGPDKRGIQLHTASGTLLGAAPTVQGEIVNSNAQGPYGYALSVPNSPETGALMITKFNATIEQEEQGRSRSLQEEEHDLPARGHLRGRVV